MLYIFSTEFSPGYGVLNLEFCIQTAIPQTGVAWFLIMEGIIAPYMQAFWVGVIQYLLRSRILTKTVNVIDKTKDCVLKGS